MSIIADIILIVLIVIAFIAGHKKGLVNSVWKIAALVATVLLVIGLKTPAVSFIKGTPAAAKLYDMIASAVNIPQGGGVNIAESLHLPEFMQSEIDVGMQNAQSAASAINDAAALSLTNIVITIIACVALFIIVRLVLMAVHMIVDSLSKAPVINAANRFMGGLLAAVNMAFIILLVLALVTIFVPAQSGLYEIINHSYIVKYFYNYNILLQLFMKT